MFRFRAGLLPPGAVFDGGSGGDQQQRVHGPGRPLGRQVSFAQQAQNRVENRQVMRPAEPGRQRDAGQARVGVQHVAVRTQHHPQAFPPATPHPAGFEHDVGEELVQHCGVQLFGVLDVHVERRGSGVQFGGEAAHGHPLDAFGAHHRERGGDDPLARQSGFRRAFAPVVDRLGSHGRSVWVRRSVASNGLPHSTRSVATICCR